MGLIQPLLNRLLARVLLGLIEADSDGSAHTHAR
jgi:hypothetical protein